MATKWATYEEIQAQKNWLDHSWDFLDETLFQLSPFDYLCITLTIAVVALFPIAYKKLKSL